MAPMLPFLLFCLQVVSIVLATHADGSGPVGRRSPQQKSAKPSPGAVGRTSSGLSVAKTSSGPPVGKASSGAPVVKTSDGTPTTKPAAPPTNTPGDPSGSPQNTGKPTPFGFGSRVTGGGNATPQTPKDPAQLEAWLTDQVPRVIVISKTYDFSSTNTTTSGCRPWKSCANGFQVQEARNFDNWCSKEYKSSTNIPVSLVASSLNPIKVKSRKTLLGVGKLAVIKGKGLSIYRVENIIIQNVHITWLNPHLVWGGDAIALDGAKDIWIDHCSFSNIGRQMIVTGGSSQVEGNKGITISSNLFMGKTQWSARCQNRHYWTAFFSGPGDEITMARNCIDFTSGRSPKAGGAGNPKVLLHYYNNLHTNTIGSTFEIDQGGNVLAEGNLFENVKTQDPDDATTQFGGRSYVPFTPADASRCTSLLGRPCVANQMVRSSPYKFSLDTPAVDAFKTIPAVARAQVLPASSIKKGAAGRCGVGYI
ncbi:hypothetical protein PCANC_00786 [Puccinia coronata f. sp. avenae]|uniref:pectin lyase n=1 Tax=Puccinia coronata f. sp. avenae TaxID=200324 RepID=A0A2N5W7R3_9BASI|nr:hypothetical protein PCANC_00786 [Puccinia coronata f. sp. avenae]